MTAFWLVGAKMLSFAVTFALPLLLVRRLSQHHYGVYKQIFLIVSTISSYGQLSFPMSSYYFFPRLENHKAIVMNVVAFLGGMGLLTAAAFSLFPQLAVKISGSAETASLSGLIGWSACFSMIGYFLEVLTVLRQEVRLSAVIIVGSAVTRGITMTAAAWIYGSLESILWAFVLQGALQTLLLMAYVRNRYPGLAGEFDRALFFRQFRYAWTFALVGFLTATLNDLHSYSVSRWFGAADFAIYAVGCLQIPLTAILTESTGPLLIRQVNILERAGRNEEIARLILAAGRKLAFVFFPLSAFLIVVGREFLTLLFTRQYLASYPVFALNLLLIPLGIFLYDPLARAFPQHQMTTVKIRVGLVVALIAVLYPLMALMGPVGAMLAVVLVALCERVLLGRLWLKILGWPKLDPGLILDIGKLAVSAAIAGACAELVRRWLEGRNLWLVLVACSVAYGIAYLGSSFKLRIVKDEERTMAITAISEFGRRLRGLSGVLS